MTALDFAIQDATARVREGKSHNRSPRIDAINRFVGNPVGSPYCAAGVSWCFHAAGANNFPFSGLAAAIHDSFRAADRVSEDPQKVLSWKGALFGWTLESGHGHIGFIRERLTDETGKLVRIRTVEYNTVQPANPNIDGVFERDRAVEPSFWFLNTSDLEGGAWWE